jgi:phenylacetate-CoA ligase
MAQSGVGRNYLIALEGLDEMTVKVELAEAGFEGQVEQLMKLQNHLAEKLRAEILIKPQVQLLPPGSLPASEGKAKRVIDNRKM